ncbi:hypothetical protein KC324_g19633, partial [Hortaea werneckii]
GFLPIAQPTAPTASGSGSVAPVSSDSAALGYSKALSYARTSPATAAPQPSESISISVVTSEQTTVVPYTTVITVYPTATSAATLSAASYGPASDSEGSQEEASQPGASTYTTTSQSTTVLTHYSTKTLNVDQPGSSGIAPAAYESDSAAAAAAAADSSDSSSKAPVSHASSSAVPPVAPDSSSVLISSKATTEPTYSASSSSAYAYTTSIPYVTTTCSYIQAPYDAGNATYPLNGTAASSGTYPTGSAASSQVCSTITLTSAVSVGPTNSANSTVTPSSSFANAKSTGTAPARTSASPIVSSNSTSLSPTGTMAPAPVNVNSNVVADSTCASLCSSLEFTGDYSVTPILCQSYEAGATVPAPSGQSEVNCDSGQGTLDTGICRVTLSIQTSGDSEAYMEVWMPNDESTSWNGRTMSTDNGGLSGCVAYDDMTYVTGLGFAAFGDNGGHNSSSFDGTAFYQSNQNVLDWAFRSRHASVVAGKDVVRQFYGQEQDYAYYIGCSTGGQQGMHSAQYFPDDFDGIIA